MAVISDQNYRHIAKMTHILNQDDRYENGLFQNGKFQNGRFQNGRFQNGQFKKRPPKWTLFIHLYRRQNSFENFDSKRPVFLTLIQ